MEGQSHPLISDLDVQDSEFGLLGFGQVFPYNALISPFGIVIYILCQCMLKYVTCFLILREFMNKRLPCVSEEVLELRFLNYIETERQWGLQKLD